jgi:hypothetical protein
VRDVQIWNGRENVQGWGAVRVLSTVSRVDNLQFDNIWSPYGQTTGYWGVLVGTFPTVLIPGPGNIGSVLFDNVSLDVLNTGGAVLTPNQPVGVFGVSGIIDRLEIRNRQRANAQNWADITLVNGSTIKELVVSGDWYQPAGAANNVPIIRNDGAAVGTLAFFGRCYRDAGALAAAAPVLRMSSASATVGTAHIHVIANRAIINVVDFTAAAAITTLMISGIHTNAGPPVAFGANAATITNLITGTGAAPLTFAYAAQGASSGSGTVVRLNSYADTGIAPPTLGSGTYLAHWDFSTLTGSAGSSVTTATDTVSSLVLTAVGTPPTLSLAAQNSKNMVQFSGAQQLKATGSWVNNLIGNMSGFVIVKNVTEATNNVIVWGGSASQGATVANQFALYTGISPSSVQWNRVGSGGQGAAIFSPADNTTVYKLVFRYNSTNGVMELWVNGGGSLPNTGLNPTAATWDTFALGVGVGTTFTGFLTGLVGEVGLINGLIGSGDVTALQSYLTSAWGS